MLHKVATVVMLLAALQLTWANNLRGPPKRCSSDEILCTASNSCIPEAWVCDRVQDCESGEDEANCSRGPQCEYEDDFMCGNGECIPAEWRCDTDVDCQDHSDERQCTYSATQHNEDPDAMEVHSHQVN